MSIASLYKKTVSTKRLSAVDGSNKTSYQPHLSGIPCNIEQIGNESTFLSEGALYKSFKMWCPINTDIQESDRVIHGATEYTVRSVKSLSLMQRSAHKEVILELAQ